MQTELSQTEIRLLRLKAQNLSIKEMSLITHFTEGTLRVYFSRLYKKIDRGTRINMLIKEQLLQNQQVLP